MPWPMPRRATAIHAVAAPLEVASRTMPPTGTRRTSRARRAGGDAFGEEAEHDAGGDLGGADEAGGDGGVEVGPAVVGEVRDEVHDRRAHRADRQREGDGEAEHRRVADRHGVGRGVVAVGAADGLRCRTWCGRPGSTRAWMVMVIDAEPDGADRQGAAPTPSVLQGGDGRLEDRRGEPGDQGEGGDRPRGATAELLDEHDLRRLVQHEAHGDADQQPRPVEGGHGAGLRPAEHPERGEDRAAWSSAARAEPRSSHRPTGNAANPDTITAIVNAPTNVARLQPRSRSIGGSSTAKP